MAATMATTRDCGSDLKKLKYDSFTKKCENYVSPSESTAEDIKCFLKSLYGVIKDTETAEGLSSGETLPELIVDNFDEEQIWQELELQNEARVDSLVGSVAKLIAQKDKFTSGTSSILKPVAQNGHGDDDSSDSEKSEDVDEEAEDEEDSDDDLELARIKARLDNDEDLNGGEFDDLNGDLDDEDDDDEGGGDDDDEDADDDEDDNDDDEEEEEDRPAKKNKGNAKQKSKKPGQPSEVDDKFFKLSEMEEFLEKEEQEKGSESDDSDDEPIDLFGEIPSDESDDAEEEDDDDDGSETEKKQMRYSDFFDAPDQENQPEKNESKAQGRKKKVKFNVDGGDSDDDQVEESEDGDSDDSQTSDLQVPGKSGIKSTYEIRQERLQAKIKKLEEEAVSEKPWQLRGEISTENRPENALLEEALEFDSSHRPAPVITEETSQRLEDIIKQRIKDKAWDDVVKKVKPVEAPSEFKKKLVLDQEKSKLSLAQVYEQEYLKQAAAADPDASDKPDEVPKEHIEIKEMVDSLFRKLDALSNFHFTPKQVRPEVKIVTNIPAINMEEVAPVATSDATLLAPEEVKAKPKGDVKSQEEKTATDKKRDRRQKKTHQRIVAREREKREAAVSKMNPGLGNKYSKEKAVKMLEKISKDSNVSLIDSRGGKAMKSSTAFFSQLQDEVKTHMKEKTQIAKKRKADSKSLSAKRLKL